MSAYDHAFDSTVRAALETMPDDTLRHIAARGARIDAARQGAAPVAGTALYDHAPRGALLHAACRGAEHFAHGADGARATAASVDREIRATLDAGARMDRRTTGALHTVIGKVKVRSGGGARVAMDGPPRLSPSFVGVAVHDARVRAARDAEALVRDHAHAKGRDAKRAIERKIRAIVDTYGDDVGDAVRAAGWRNV